MKWIIIDVKKNMALYGSQHRTLAFSTKEIALEVGLQFFEFRDNFILVEAFIEHFPSPQYTQG